MFVNDDVLDIVASFIKTPKDWKSFLLVSTQFCYCGKLGINFAINNNNAIKRASEEGYEHSVSFLLSCPKVDPANNNNTAIRGASENGYDKVVALLLKDPRVDPSVCNDYAIRRASDNGHDKVVELLLANSRVDPSAVNNYAIRWASMSGHDKVVALLLKDPRVDPSDCGNYAIRMASSWGRDKVVALLLTDPRVDPSVANSMIKPLLILEWGAMPQFIMNIGQLPQSAIGRVSSSIRTQNIPIRNDKQKKQFKTKTYKIQQPTQHHHKPKQKSTTSSLNCRRRPNQKMVLHNHHVKRTSK